MNIATTQAQVKTLSGSDSIRTDCKITVKIMSAWDGSLQLLR
jgi:hypothetical protein